MMKSFYIFRHGQTDYNVQKRLQGRLDIPLNDQGIAQAQTLAQKLSNIKFDCIYTSPLSRVLKTAQIVAEKNNSKIIPEPGLQEWNLGVFCGKIIHITQDPVDTPINMDSDIVNVPFALFTNNDFIPENGESYNMLKNRVHDTLIKIATTKDAETIGIATHGGVMRAIIKQFTDLTYPRQGVPNAEFIKMQWDGENLTLPEPPDWLLNDQ